MFKKSFLSLCVLVCSVLMATLSGCEEALGMLGLGQASLTIGTLAVPNLPIGGTEIITVSAKSASGDAETFSATSDDETVATLIKGANSITLTGVAVGKAIVKVVSASNKTGYIDVAVVWPKPKPGVLPSILSVAPLADATAVSTATKVSAVFAATMDAATITSANFTLTGPSSTSVAGAVEWNAALNSAIFTPSAALAAGTLYTAKISTAVKDSLGTALAADKTWTFTTAGTPVVPSPVPGTAPTVTSVAPPDNATGVAVSTTVSAVFSTTMDAATMTTANFTLVGPNLVHVVGTVAWNAATNTVSFAPSSPLAEGTQYTAKLSTAIKDSAGTAMAAYKVWGFTTASTIAAPTIISVTPTMDATGVETTTWVKVTFSTAMDAASITANSFMLFGPGNVSVGGTVSYDAGIKKASFAPSAALAASSTYTAKVSSTIKDANGVHLAADKTWSFTTAAAAHGLVNWDFQDSGSFDSPTTYTTGGQTVTDVVPGWALSYGVNSGVNIQINIGSENSNNYMILKQTIGASGNAIYMVQNPNFTITPTSTLKVRFQMKSNQSGATYYYDCSAFSVLFTISGTQYLVLIRSDAAHVSAGDTRPGTQTNFNEWYTAEVPLAGLTTLQMHLAYTNTGTPITLSAGTVIDTVMVRVNNDVYETWIDYVDIQ